MYLIHSLKPGTLTSVLKSRMLRPSFCRYSIKNGIWFNALPLMINEINANDNIWRENVLFFNRGPVLVFEQKILKKHSFDIEIMNKNGMNITKLRDEPKSHYLRQGITTFFNHPENEKNCLLSSRWFHSHRIVTDETVPLDGLIRILVYKDEHYDEIPMLLKHRMSSVDWRDISKNPISFYELYEIIRMNRDMYTNSILRPRKLITTPSLFAI